MKRAHRQTRPVLPADLAYCTCGQQFELETSGGGRLHLGDHLVVHCPLLSDAIVSEYSEPDTLTDEPAACAA